MTEKSQESLDKFHQELSLLIEKYFSEECIFGMCIMEENSSTLVSNIPDEFKIKKLFEYALEKTDKKADQFTVSEIVSKQWTHGLTSKPKPHPEPVNTLFGQRPTGLKSDTTWLAKKAGTND